MPENYADEIRDKVAGRVSLGDIAEQVYLTFPPIGFKDDWTVFHIIRKRVAIEFDVPITSIHVCGSCQLGMSPIKFTPFEKGKSDLDLAIVDATLFAKMLRETMEVTGQFRDLTRFGRRDGSSDYERFVRNVSQSGMVRPDLMPRCEARIRWFDSFSKISGDYLDLFKNISGGVYLSEYFFASRQISALEKMKDGL